MALAAQLDVAEQNHEGPSTSTEHWLACVWAEVLSIPKDQIGRRDHFFDLGGTSLSVLKLAIALKRAVSFKDLAGHPILADLAELIERRLEGGIPPPVPGGSGRHAATATMAIRGGEGVR